MRAGKPKNEVLRLLKFERRNVNSTSLNLHQRKKIKQLEQVRTVLCAACAARVQ